MDILASWDVDRIAWGVTIGSLMFIVSCVFLVCGGGTWILRMVFHSKGPRRK